MSYPLYSISRDPRIKYLNVTQDTKFFCHQLSTMKLGFLGLSEAVEKARMVRFRRKPSVHPFLTILKLSGFRKNKMRIVGFEPAMTS